MFLKRHYMNSETVSVQKHYHSCRMKIPAKTLAPKIHKLGPSLLHLASLPYFRPDSGNILAVFAQTIHAC